MHSEDFEVLGATALQMTNRCAIAIAIGLRSYAMRILIPGCTWMVTSNIQAMTTGVETYNNAVPGKM
jgi:hypothetical protein